MPPSNPGQKTLDDSLIFLSEFSNKELIKDYIIEITSSSLKKISSPLIFSKFLTLKQESG